MAAVAGAVDTTRWEESTEAATTTTSTSTGTQSPNSSWSGLCGDSPGDPSQHEEEARVGAVVEDTEMIPIGARLGIWWDGDRTYYPCTVVHQRTQKHPNTKDEQKHEWFLEYDDGTDEWLDLTREQVCWITDDEDAPATMAEDENTHPTIDDAEDDDGIDQEWTRIYSEIHAELKTTKKKKKNYGTMDESSGGSPTTTFKTTEEKGYSKNQSGNFTSRIYYFGKRRYIGTFSNEEAASLAFQLARSKIKLANSKDADDDDAIEQEWARIHSKVFAEWKTKKKKNCSNMDRNGGSTNKISKTSGTKGYYKNKKTGNFEARIYCFGKPRTIGSFNNEEDAALAYAIAKSEIELSTIRTPSKEKGMITAVDKKWHSVRAEVKTIIQTTTPDKMKQLLIATPAVEVNRYVTERAGRFIVQIFCFGKTRVCKLTFVPAQYFTTITTKSKINNTSCNSSKK